MSPQELEHRLYEPAGVDLKDVLSVFVAKFFSFESSAITPIDSAYKAYFEYFDFDNDSVLLGDALSRHKFTRWVLSLYIESVEEKVCRYQGKITRCFTGVRLRSLEEVAE
jgi:hypothetical protein